MRLDHLNLTVTDVGAAKSFLATYFGLTAVAGVSDRDDFALLRDDAGMLLTLMDEPGGREVRYPSRFHIGFTQPTEDAVDAVHRRLTGDGHEIPAPKRFHGSWTFYFKAPGSVLVEVLC